MDMSEEKQLSSHEGEEFMYVLEGEVEVRYGKDVYVLSKGDTIYYETPFLAILPFHPFTITTNNIPKSALSIICINVVLSFSLFITNPAW